MFVAAGVQNLLSAHGTNSLLVSTALTIERILVESCFASLTSGGIWLPPLLFAEQLVFVDLPSTTFGHIRSAFLPLVWHYNLAELLLTFGAYHYQELHK